MKKRAISASVTLLFICFQAEAQTPPQGILQCAGPWDAKGINTPKDVTIPSASTVEGAYTFKGNLLIASGGGTWRDQQYDLCSVTSTNAVYSTDCSISLPSYTAEWLAVRDMASLKAFQARHPNGWVQLETIVVDRVNLTMDDTDLSTEERVDPVPGKTTPTVKPYLLSMHFAGQCQLAKAKF